MNLSLSTEKLDLVLLNFNYKLVNCLITNSPSQKINKWFNLTTTDHLVTMPELKQRIKKHSFPLTLYVYIKTQLKEKNSIKESVAADTCCILLEKVIVNMDSLAVNESLSTTYRRMTCFFRSFYSTMRLFPLNAYMTTMPTLQPIVHCVPQPFTTNNDLALFASISSIPPLSPKTFKFLQHEFYSTPTPGGALNVSIEYRHPSFYSSFLSQLHLDVQKNLSEAISTTIRQITFPPQPVQRDNPTTRREPSSPHFIKRNSRAIPSQPSSFTSTISMTPMFTPPSDSPLASIPPPAFLPDFHQRVRKSSSREKIGSKSYSEDVEGFLSMLESSRNRYGSIGSSCGLETSKLVLREIKEREKSVEKTGSWNNASESKDKESKESKERRGDKSEEVDDLLFKMSGLGGE